MPAVSPARHLAVIGHPARLEPGSSVSSGPSSSRETHRKLSGHAAPRRLTRETLHAAEYLRLKLRGVTARRLRTDHPLPHGPGAFVLCDRLCLVQAYP